jgi:acyl-CoA thioesterase FadM
VTCDFTRPVRFEDVLTIGVLVERVGTKSVTYRFDFTHAGQAVATGRITAVFCQAVHPHGLQAIPIPDNLRAKLEATE